MNYNPDIRTALKRLLQLRQTDTHALLGSDWHNAFEAAGRAFYAHTTDISKLPLQERQHLAHCSNTPPETLTILAQDESVNARYGVACNPNTTPETLTLLARDKYFDVRNSVARNSNTSPETLAILARDANDRVRRAAQAALDQVGWQAEDLGLILLAAAGVGAVGTAKQNPNYTPVKELKVTAKQYEALKKLLAASQDEDLKSILSNLN